MRYLRAFLFLAVVSLPSFLLALNCGECGREIHGQYVRDGGRALCSKECYETKKHPRCHGCGEHLNGSYSSFQSADKTRLMCASCSKLPRCFACDMPGHGQRLPDGRMICNECGRDTVSNPAEAEKLFRKIEREVMELIGSNGCGKVGFVLTDMNKLNKDYRNNPGEKFELGRTHYEYSTRQEPGKRTVRFNEKCTIYVLSHLPVDQFIEVAAHEITHDWINHNLGVVPLIWREGFPEYIASLINEKYGNGARNARMARNSDPIYGGGYRMVRDYAAKHGWNGLLRRMHQFPHED